MFELVPYALLTVIVALLIDRFVGELRQTLRSAGG